MLKRVCMAAAVLALATAPAFAADMCGASPVAPLIPGAADLQGKTPEDAHKVASDAFKLVKIYQTALQPFYSCVEQQTASLKKDIDDATQKKDQAKIASLQQSAADLDKKYQSTVGTEKQVVADYMALHNSYCAMGTGLAGCAPAPAAAH